MNACRWSPATTVSRCTGADASNRPTAANDNQKPGCSSAQGSSSVTTSAAANSSSGHGQRMPSDASHAALASIHTVRCAGTPQPANSAYSAAQATPPQRAAVGAGSASSARSLRRHSQPTSAPASQANIVTCKPLMLTRCAMPVARNNSQSLRSMAAWSPTASAASTPAARASATCSVIASRTRWRRRSTGCAAPSASRSAGAFAVARTSPVARMPCSNSHSSKSKPCGLSAPCGCFRRTVKRQRWPARRASNGALISASSFQPRYQPSEMRDGSVAGRPSNVALSTSNVKRTPSADWRGRPATTPATTMSRPSSAAGRWSARRTPARRPVTANSAVASASASAHVRAAAANQATARPHTPRRRSGQGSRRSATACGCCICSAAPAMAASATAAARRPQASAIAWCGPAIDTV